MAAGSEAAYSPGTERPRALARRLGVRSPVAPALEKGALVLLKRVVEDAPADAADEPHDEVDVVDVRLRLAERAADRDSLERQAGDELRAPLPQLPILPTLDDPEQGLVVVALRFERPHRPAVGAVQRAAGVVVARERRGAFVE